MDVDNSIQIQISNLIVFDIDLLYMQEDDMRSQIYYELEDIPKKNYKKYLLLSYSYTFKRYCIETND